MPATIANYVDQLSSVSAPASDDVLIIHDTSAGTPGKVTLAAALSGYTGRVVDTTATTLTVTAAAHANRIVTISSAAPIAVTLPAATGTGNTYRFVFEVAATATTSSIKCVGTDDFAGMLAQFDTSATDITGIAFAATATDDTIAFDGTTRSGVLGTIVELIDVATGHWAGSVRGPATGSYATPFSATV